VGRIKINDEQYPAKLPAGTLARIEAVLVGKEKRSDFIRLAIETELARRELKAGLPSARPRARSKDEE